MVMLSVGALLLALAADPPAETGQRGSAQPADANRAAGNAQQSSRDTAGGDERTGPPAPGIQSGDANGMAGGRTDQGPRGGAGIREGGDRLRKDRARARASGQARGRNRKGSFERPADAPADMNRDPKPMGSGAPADPAEQSVPRGPVYREGAEAGAAGGVASGSEGAPGGSSPRGTSGKGAGTQPDKKQTGSEPDAPK
jgi:hypothetical protein